ncbi:MAG: helix-turn-helix transcriptional regulator [Actinomycetota bacterium]
MRPGARLLWTARRRAGLSQRALSRRSGVPQPTISRIERELESPSADLLARLVDACGMELAVIERAGRGVDRTLILEQLRGSPSQRGRDAARGAEVLERLGAARPVDREAG